ncbi:MAG: nuclear transport factor 2 family protein [Pseudomonadota bacterium]
MTHNPEETQVAAVIDRYVQGYINADEAALRDVFAVDAVMNGYVGDRLVIGTPEPFIQRAAAEPPLAGHAPDLAYQIETLSVTGAAAAVVLRETGFGDHNFIDYMHLLKRDGAWKIVSKTFSTF